VLEGKEEVAIPLERDALGDVTHWIASLFQSSLAQRFIVCPSHPRGFFFFQNIRRLSLLLHKL
jgi:hypothetical protein